MLWSEALLPAICILQGLQQVASKPAIPSTELELARSLVHLAARSLSNGPTGTYAPGNVSCPGGNLVRSAGSLSTSETNWLKGRKNVTKTALQDFLTRANMTDFDVSSFLNSYTPTIGLAFSGGGYRAMLVGAGVLSAFDSRTVNSTNKGGLGGLLQSSTYLAGLSGGSWLVGSIVVNNFTSVQDILSGGELWDLQNSILAPNSAWHIVSNVEYYADLIKEVGQKDSAGFDVSLTDYWGRALSRQFVNYTNGGPAVTYSSIADTSPFNNFEMPFPIITSDGRAPGEKLVSLNTTVYEFNPYEMGSFDPTLYAFTQTKYLGTNVNKGVPTTSQCIAGFDNAGYVMGTSSSLFNQLLLQLNTTGTQSVLNKAVAALLTGISEADNDIAQYYPNPFYGINPSTYPSASTKNLSLVDGGEDLENIPFNPLIQPQRNVDVIFASDNSADVVTDSGGTVNWPNGTALVATYERSLNAKMSNGTLFPSIPAQNTFVNLKLNTRPTFFGCDSSNYSSPANAGPLVVYLPNAPYTYFSNTTTLTLAYPNDQRNNIIQNGYNVGTQANGTGDVEWPACVGCAIVRREQERTGATQSAQCIACFQRYCWNGTVNNTQPHTYEPSLFIVSKKSGVDKLQVWNFGIMVWSVVVGTVVLTI